MITWRPVQPAGPQDHPGYIKESLEPFGYTLFVHLDGKHQRMGATWRGEPYGPSTVHLPIRALRNTPEVKKAASELLAACEAHWEKIRPRG